MKRKKLQENSPDPTGDTERGWMWKIHCPSCNDPVVLAMPDSGMKKMRTLLQGNVGSNGRTAEIWGGGLCGKCNQKSLTKFSISGDGELVCAMVSDPPPGGITMFSRPELDLTPGFTENFNFSLN